MQQPPTPPCIYPFFRKRGKIPKNMGFSAAMKTARPASRAENAANKFPVRLTADGAVGLSKGKVKTCGVFTLVL